MAKNLEFSFLLDFYGEMLTEKQREAIDYYYNKDFSLSEIAYNQGITRQGVHDTIKRAENLLINMEEKFGLVERFNYINQGLEQILDEIRNIINNNDNLALPNNICDSILKIENLAIKIREKGNI